MKFNFNSEGKTFLGKLGITEVEAMKITQEAKEISDTYFNPFIESKSECVKTILAKIQEKEIDEIALMFYVLLDVFALTKKFLSMNQPAKSAPPWPKISTKDN